MPAYLQMGNDTENLVGEKDLEGFEGIVLSPVNREPLEIRSDIVDFRRKGFFDIVLDPQLYLPHSERGCLQSHAYFPSDLDTADIQSDAWWTKVVADLVECAKQYRVDAIASPVVLPKVWSDDYFGRCRDTASALKEGLTGSALRTLTTVMVSLEQLTAPEARLRIASILSDAAADGYYLVIVSETPPRSELSDDTELLGLMLLIAELESSGREVLVSHCSSDMILFKAAGASHCASGKFFNLRRFTKSRYEEPSKGGKQLAYSFQHSLMAFLRESDVLRLQNEGRGKLIGSLASNNYWSEQIAEQWREDPTKPWLGLSWRQYLSWFWQTENLVSQADSKLVGDWLREAEQNWLDLEDQNILFAEPRNDGKWIRPWRLALNDFLKRK